MEIAKIGTKIVPARMLCEFSKFLSVLIIQKLKIVVRRGALRYWTGEGLEPIPNECPFLGYPAECCIRDPLPGLQGPKILLPRPMQYVRWSTAGLIPLLYSLLGLTRALKQISTTRLYCRSRQPVLCGLGASGPTTGTG